MADGDGRVMASRKGPSSAPAGASEITSALLVTPRWTRDGGVATHVVASAALLAANGVEVTVLSALADHGDPARNVTVLESPQLFDENAEPSERVAGAISSPPDVIHCHQFDDPGVLRFMQRLAPVVLSAHGYTACTAGVHYFRPGEECTRQHGPGCWPNLLLRGCAHTNNPRRLPANYRRADRGVKALRDADLAISYSSAVDRHLATNGILRRRVVPLFTTLEPAEGDAPQARRRILFAGRVVAPKGVDVLIRAVRSIDAELVVCGDGWRLDEMRGLATQLGLQERVRFTGWLPPRELAREIAEASVIAMPSVWPEPFGLAGIEAFEAGRPVVASLTGGIGDWLRDGVNGLAVPPGDGDALANALVELLDDPARAAAMGAAGRELARTRFSPERHLEALLEAYRQARDGWRSRGAALDERPAAGAVP
jgi:glycosyltransferase involved in cell wall biosynthesis